MGSWSELRKKVRGRLAESVRDRIDVHFTIYQGKNKHYGYREDKHRRFWITVDGIERLGLGCCGPHLNLDGEPMLIRDVPATDRGIRGYMPDDAIRALKASFNMSVDDMIASPDPIIRAFAMVDARCGIRRLRKIDPQEKMHELVRLFYDLRVMALAAPTDGP